MKKWGFLLLKIAVTAGLLSWLFSRMDLARLLSQLRQADPVFLILALLIVWLGHFLCVLRWKCLLLAFEVPIRTLALVLIYAIGIFFNLVFPGLVGGDLVKTYLAGKESRQPYSLTFATIFLDRDVGLVAMAMIAVTAALINPLRVQGYNLVYGFLGLLGICVAFNALLFHKTAHHWFLSRLTYARLAGIRLKLTVLSEAFVRVRRRTGILAGALGLSLVNQVIVIASSWLIALSLGIEAPFRHFLVFIPAIVVITMIPVSINGVGLREFAYMSFFTTIGVSQEQGVLMGFLASLLIVVSGLPGAVAYVLHRREVNVERITSYGADLAGGSQAP